MKRSFLKKIIAILYITFLISHQISAFGDASHEYITQKAIEFVSQMDFTKASSFKDEILKEKDKYETCGEFYKSKDKQFLIKSALQPDITETDGGTFKAHFYNPNTEKNYMGEKEGALWKLETHYEAAVNAYYGGNINKSENELGNAMHFMEDLSIAVHTGYELPSDSLGKLKEHIDFEKLCDKLLPKCIAEIIPESLEYFQINSIKTIGHRAAVEAQQNFYKLEEVDKIPDEEIAKNCIFNAQKNTTGLLWRFYLDVRRPKNTNKEKR